MAAPTVQGTPTVSQQSNNGVPGRTLTLPSSIQVGELLIAICSGGGGANDTWDFPVGWTRLAGASNCWHGIAYRIADGSEGASINVDAGSGGNRSCHVTYRISGHDPGSAPVIGTEATGSSTAGNPPSVAHGWGTVDFLSIACLNSQSNTDPTSPSGYSTGQHQQNSGTALEVATAELAVLAATSEDPPAFTNGNAAWRCQTILIRGASAAVRTDRFFLMF